MPAGIVRRLGSGPLVVSEQLPARVRSLKWQEERCRQEGKELEDRAAAGMAKLRAKPSKAQCAAGREELFAQEKAVRAEGSRAESRPLRSAFLKRARKAPKS